MPTLMVRLLLGSIAVILSLGQSQDMISLARDQGGEAHNGVEVDFPIRSVSSLAMQSTRVVRGTLRRVQAKLSADGSQVETEVDLAMSRAYKDIVVVSKTPAGPRDLTAVLPGGSMVIDGLRLSTTMNGLRSNERLQPGDEVLLFLRRDSAGVNRVVGVEFGVLKIAGRTVTTLVPASGFAEALPMDVDSFEARIIAAATTGR